MLLQPASNILVPFMQPQWRRGRGTAGGGFTPSGMELWLSDTGASAATWPDLSGNGRDATQGTAGKQPAIIAAELNGHQVRRCDGGDRLTGSMPITGTTGTAFAVGKMNTATAGYGRLLSIANIDGQVDYNTAGQCAWIIRNSSNNGMVSYRAGSLSSHPVTLDTWFVCSSVFDGTNNTLYIDGQTTGAVGSTGTFTSQFFAIGGHTTEGDFWTGDIAEVIVYDTALSTGDREDVEDYLGAKYGISITH